MLDCTPEQPQLKTCTKCGQAFPATAEHFHRDRRKRNGLKPLCKACALKQRATYYKVNREQELAYHAAWRKANSEKARVRDAAHHAAHRTQRVAYSAVYYKANYEAILEKKRKYNATNCEKIRAYRKANRDRRREYNAAWRKANPEKVRERNRRRRARKAGAEGSHTAEDVRKLLELSKGRCWWCGKKLPNGDYHIDHRMPLARGGTDSPDNLVISCPTCNTSRGAKLPDEWNGRLL